jgi:hypothetical protein
MAKYSLISLLREAQIQCEYSPTSNEVIIYGGWQIRIPIDAPLEPTAQALQEEVMALMVEMNLKMDKVRGVISKSKSRPEEIEDEEFEEI